MSLSSFFFKIEDLESLFLAIFGVLAICMSISWVSFSRLTMARIDRRLREEGKSRLCSWDGVGARALWYAWAIAVPVGKANPANDPFVDVMTVRQMATRADRVRAMALMIFGYSFLISVLIGALLGYY